MKNTSDLVVLAMGYYGERTALPCSADKIEDVVDEVLTGTAKAYRNLLHTPIERKIVHIPNSENVVIYNQHREDEDRADYEKYFAKDGYVRKPFVTVLEQEIEIYSPCVICRLDQDRNVTGLKDGDYETYEAYLKPIAVREARHADIVEVPQITKITELESGDFVVFRDGTVAVVVRTGQEDGRFIFAESGFDDFMDYTDDMRNESEYEDGEWDIMKVYRGQIGFNDYVDGDIVFSRD